MARVIILVLDSVGIGALPDAADYGDEGANTLVNTARITRGLGMPTLRSLGLGNITAIAGIPPISAPLGSFGRMAEISPGKDTLTGHWEMAGTPLKKAFHVYPDGFPPEVMERFTEHTGLGYLGNCHASGTKIINELGDEHMRTGKPIIYTSSDSVFQIAAHEDVISPNQLYELCMAVQAMFTMDFFVGRVIARPFVGKDGDYTRTSRRRDFALLPPPGNLWEKVHEAGIDTVAVGKIHDIFGGQNIDFTYPTNNNDEVVEQVLRAMAYHKESLIWANLVDFDMHYGHRNDYKGYALALERLDMMLPRILGALTPDDMLIITADHGADPTMPGTDHTREYVPLIITGKKLRRGLALGTRKSFADIAATAADFLGIGKVKHGESLFHQLILPGEEISRGAMHQSFVDIYTL